MRSRLLPRGDYHGCEREGARPPGEKILWRGRRDNREHLDIIIRISELIYYIFQFHKKGEWHNCCQPSCSHHLPRLTCLLPNHWGQSTGAATAYQDREDCWPCTGPGRWRRTPPWSHWLQCAPQGKGRTCSGSDHGRTTGLIMLLLVVDLLIGVAHLQLECCYKQMWNHDICKEQ